MRRKFTVLLAAAALLAAGGAVFRLREGMGAQEVIRKLGALRISAELYRLDRKHFPLTFADTVRSGKLEAVPRLKLRWHPACDSVRDVRSAEITGSGCWAYVNDPKNPDFGLIYIDSAGKDEKGRYWSEF